MIYGWCEREYFAHPARILGPLFCRISVRQGGGFFLGVTMDSLGCDPAIRWKEWLEGWRDE